MEKRGRRYFSKEGLVTIAISLSALIAISIFGLRGILKRPADFKGIVVDNDSGAPVDGQHFGLPLRNYQASTDTIPVDITGIVVDKDTGLPIEGAHFSLPLTGYHAWTDSLGIFTIEDLKPKQYYASIWHNYYDRSELIFSVPPESGLVKLDTIRLSIDFLPAWPIPDSIKADSSLKSMYFSLPEECFSSRTNRLSKSPANIIARKDDSHGGRWILGYFGNNAGPCLTYMSQQGIFESCLPTGLDDPVISEFAVFEDTLIIAGIEPHNFKEKEFRLVYTINDMVIDTDKDGLIDKFEDFYGLDPDDPDTDGDGIDDLSDPLPAIAKPRNTNDTLEVLRKCLELVGHPFSGYEATGFSLSYMLEALPDSPAERLLEIAERRTDFSQPSLQRKYTYGLELVNQPSSQSRFLYPYSVYGQNFCDRKSSFEITLIGMTPQEMRYFYPYLDWLSDERNYPISKHILGFPYLESMALANSSNVRRIRQEILSCAFTALIQPEIIDQTLLDYPAHPAVSGAMYIESEGHYNSDRIEKASERMPFLRIVRMDDNSAIVHVKTGGQAWDKVFLKRGHDWIIVGDYPYSTIPPRESLQKDAEGIH
jgi:hypothetical protein